MPTKTRSFIPTRSSVSTPIVVPMLLVLAVLVFPAGCATGASPGSLTSGMDLHLLGSATPPILTGATGGAGGFPIQTDGSPAGGALACGGVPVPPGWPDLSSGDSEALLAPFLACASPGEYVALQQRVDMPRLVEALDDWSAVRLGALGPVREDAAAILHRKRVSFLLAVTERYGLFYAEVFALFVLHSAHDDDVAASNPFYVATARCRSQESASFMRAVNSNQRTSET